MIAGKHIRILIIGGKIPEICIKSALGKCEHVNEMLAILGIDSEYGDNCIAAERHVGVSLCSLGLRVFTLHNSFGVSR